MDYIQDLLVTFANDPVGSLIFLFLNGGWIALALLLLWLLFILYSFYIQGKYISGIKWHLLAIDIPKEEGMALKKVENFFATLLGAHGSITMVEKYVYGEVQHWFSLEIVSIDGYIQFMIRTSEKYRDLVEAAVYAQWPEAEITEVEDYTKDIPRDLPNDDYKLFGMEWINVQEEAYPLRTYRNFEHTMTQTFADPLGTVLETFSRGLPGEQFWYQIIITPINESWKLEGRKLVKKLIGAPVDEKKGIIDMVLSPIWKVFYSVAQEVFGLEDVDEKKNFEPPSQILYLSPGEQNIVQGIEEKLEKIGYKSKVRFVYIAKPEIFKKNKAANPMIGAIKQTNTQNMGALKPADKTVTKVNYFFPKFRVRWRIRQVLQNYKNRSNVMGIPGLGFVLNIEELATLWHFPGIEMSTPPIARVEAKKGSPPVKLPFEQPTVKARPTRPQPSAKSARPAAPSAPAPEAVEGEAPPDLPFV